MSDAFEKSLDEIIGESKSDSRSTRRPRSSRGPRAPRDRSRERLPERHRNDREDYRERTYKPRETKLQRLSGGKPYIKISNVHYDLRQEDLEELLAKIGEVEFVLLEYARDGRSSGVAYAAYKNPDDNITAVNKFDGRKAVGQVIDVELIKPLVISGVPGRAPRSRGGRGGRGERGERRERAKKPTAEDLDKELEAYMDNKPFAAASSAGESAGDMY